MCSKKEEKKRLSTGRKKKVILKPYKKTKEARLEPLTCGNRPGRSTAGPNIRGYEKISPRGMIMFHSRKKTSSIQLKNLKQGTRTKIPGGKRLRKCWKPFPPRPEIRSFPGDRASRPWEGSFRRPPLAEFGVGALPFADNTLCRCVGRVWHGRAAAGDPVALGS